MKTTQFKTPALATRLGPIGKVQFPIPTLKFPLLLALLALASGPAPAASVGSLFTYQGKLSAGGAPAGGHHDLRFTLYDAAVGGSAVGGPITNSPVLVTNGLFVTTLDFGTSAFGGEARWLEIGVRPTGGADFTNVAPRQPLTAAPLAFYAIQAGIANAFTNPVADGQLSANIPRLNVAQTFLGSLSALSLSGNGVGLTNLSASALTAGTVADARLSANIPRLSAGATFNGTVSAAGDLVGDRLRVGANHSLSGTDSSIAGGYAHQNLSSYALIGGGLSNLIQTAANGAVIAGGQQNTVLDWSFASAIGGGQANTIQPSSRYATIAGGYNNQTRTNADYAMIPGGWDNVADTLALAAGRRAKATNQGAFVWADSQNVDFGSTSNNQFLVRAAGGMGINTNKPQSTLHVAGTVTATNFSGPGLGLTSLNGAALMSGSVSSDKIAAGTLSHLDAPDGAPVNALQVSSNGWVGVGTTTPRAGLDIASGAPGMLPAVLCVITNGTGGFTNFSSDDIVLLRTNLMAVVSPFFGAVTLVDVSSPAAPLFRSTIRDGSGSFTNLEGANCAALSGNLLAVGSQDASAVTLVDVADPAAPVRRSVIRDGVGVFTNLAGVQTLAMSGTLLAVAANKDDAITLVNVTTPTSPSRYSTILNGVGGFNYLSDPVAMALSGNLLVVVSFADDAVSLINVANRSVPTLYTNLVDGVGGFDDLNGVQDVALSGNLLALSSAYDAAVTLVDVSNPASPQLLATMKNPLPGFHGQFSPYHVEFMGNFLLVSESTMNGLMVVDVSNPSAPVVRTIMANGFGAFSPFISPTSAASSTNLAVGAADRIYLVDLYATHPVGLVSDAWVGIGTAAPLAPLHVHGNLLIESGDWVSLRADAVEMGTSEATGFHATAMGEQALASGTGSLAAGVVTRASGTASVALGFSTEAGGRSSTALGDSTAANGDFSFAAGRSAHADHRGAFVWADAGGPSGTVFSSTGSNQFLIRATGGVGINTNQPQSALQVAGTVIADRFVGTLDTLAGQALELKANGQRVLRLEPDPDDGPNVIGGSSMNFIAPGVTFATIGGGGGGPFRNTNSIAANGGTIAGGSRNSVASGAVNAGIGGGWENVIQSNAMSATIAGGYGNTIRTNASYASILGGLGNVAGGEISLAAGYMAQALHPGAFVWADRHAEAFASTSSNQFLIRAGGGVGLNTNNPQSALHVHGTVTATNFAGSGAGLSNLNGLAITPYSIGAAALSNGVVLASKLANGAVNHLDAPDGAPTNVVMVNSSGLVGINTNNPQSTLHVHGTVTATSFSGPGAGLTGLDAASVASGTMADARLSANVVLLGASQTFTGRPAFNGGVSGSTSPFTVDSTTKVANLNADLLDGLSSTAFLDKTGDTMTGQLTVTTTETDGNGVVGEANNGTAARGIWGKSTNGFAGFFSGIVKIDADSSSTRPHLRLLEAQATDYARLELQASSHAAWQIAAGGSENVVNFYNTNHGNVVSITEDGNLRANVLTLMGGADVAEPFPISGETLPKGSVVVIDDEHPGQLKPSARPYDTRVAGIVSGAGGVKPGLSLQQQGVIEGGQLVALSGRVYALADASQGPIQPGDLLTTSSTPGHAMKAADPARAHGAILGKAMTGLKEGQGLVLVLVSLH